MKREGTTRTAEKKREKEKETKMKTTKKAWREVRGQAFHTRATTHQVDARAGPHAPLIQQSEKKKRNVENKSRTPWRQ